MIYVLYHAKCYDGFGAAYAAWKWFKDEAKYIPVSHGNPPPEMDDCNFLYIVDFAYNEETLCKLHDEHGCEITILDHHKTAEEMLKGLDDKYKWLNITFDMTKSGALLAWEHFHTNPINGNIPSNKLIEHISDRDLWEFKLNGSKEVHQSLLGHPMDFEVWDSLCVAQLKEQGKVLIDQYNNLVNNICDNSFLATIGGYEVPVVNTSIAWSEVGNTLCKNNPDSHFCASFTVFENNIMWSLRSIGDFDVSDIAKKYGGGGHKNAAGGS